MKAIGFLIDMIAVGQGDAFLRTLDTPAGETHVLIDGGPPSAGDLVADFVTQHAGTQLNASARASAFGASFGMRLRRVQF